MTPADAPLPLEGVRVCDLSWVWAGPYATLQLAHLGAEVIRVESRRHPCITRRVQPYAGDQPDLDRCGSFNQYNQGKRSLQLDLSKPEAVVIARELAAISDIVVENFSAGVVDRLGLGWPALSQINPRLIMISLSGYGLSGPLRDRLAYGMPVVMFSGLASLSGFPAGDPSDVGISYGDPNQGLHGAFVVLAALWRRARTGHGQFIDLSQAEALTALLPEGLLPATMRHEQLPRMGNRDIQMAPHGVYRCAGEDRWVSIVIRGDEEWRRFARLIGDGLEEDARFRTQPDRKRNEDALDELVSAWTAGREAWAITRTLQDAGLAAFPVMDCRDVAEDRHLAERDYFVTLDHPAVGRRQHAGIPWRYSETPVAVRRPAPCMGEANEYVITQLLSRSYADYQRLLREGVIV